MAKVVAKFPPNYEDICAAMPAVRKNEAIVFVYGDTIYSPRNTELRGDVLAHEEVHVQRQSKTPPAVWWHKYLTDVEYRLNEELLAYRVQYQYMHKNYSRPKRRRILMSIAKDLSGAMYGKMITKEQAIKMIQGKA